MKRKGGPKRGRRTLLFFPAHFHQSSNHTTKDALRRTCFPLTTLAHKAEEGGGSKRLTPSVIKQLALANNRNGKHCGSGGEKGGGGKAPEKKKKEKRKGPADRG